MNDGVLKCPSIIKVNPSSSIDVGIDFQHYCQFYGNENGGSPNDCTSFSNIFMTSYVFPYMCLFYQIPLMPPRLPRPCG